MAVLERISSPDDLHALDRRDLPVLAEEIRDVIIETVSRIGGRLSTNLGIVELTIALHYVFDARRDVIVWDIGDQTYTHKILSGRAGEFETLRQEGGLSGYASRAESPCDRFDAGHASTSVSAAAGFAVARDRRGEKHAVIAVIGDGGLTGGMAYEALDHAGGLGTPLLVVFNDNGMSVGPNVGALTHSVVRMVTSERYTRFQDHLENFINSLPRVGPDLLRAKRRLDSLAKGMVPGGAFFEELGFRYVGPIEGHDLSAMIDVLGNLRASMTAPTVLHVRTVKGRGYAPAEVSPVEFHDTGAFDASAGTPPAKPSRPFVEAFGTTLVKLARRDPSLCAVTAAMVEDTGLSEFAQAFPERLFDAGVAVGHAVTFAAGLAAGGMKPVCAIGSTFLQRGYDQILHDVARQNLPVVFAVNKSGFVDGEGDAHQGLFDVSFLRGIPNMVVLAPADASELPPMIEWALARSGPVAIRYPDLAEATPPFKEHPIELGKACVIRDGDRVAIWAAGHVLGRCMSAARLLAADGIECAVVNARFVSPLDTGLLREHAHRIGGIVTVEENVCAGGFGSAVAEALAAAGFSVPITILAAPAQFLDVRSSDAARRRTGLDPEGIADAVRMIAQQRST